MSNQPGGNNTIIVAIIGAIATLGAAYMAVDKSSQNTSLRGEVTDYRQELDHLQERYDSLQHAYNRLNRLYRTVTRITDEVMSSQAIDSPTPTQNSEKPSLGEARLGNHIIQLKRVKGDRTSQQVTIDFLVTNEQYDNYEQLWMKESIGKFEGKTYYAIRAILGDKRGEGVGGWTYPQMQTIKGEPTEATMVWADVPATVDKFSTLIINANGDHIAFKNVPIDWR